MSSKMISKEDLKKLHYKKITKKDLQMTLNSLSINYKSKMKKMELLNLLKDYYFNEEYIDYFFYFLYNRIGCIQTYPFLLLHGDKLQTEKYNYSKNLLPLYKKEIEELISNSPTQEIFEAVIRRFYRYSFCPKHSGMKFKEILTENICDICHNQAKVMVERLIPDYGFEKILFNDIKL